MTVEYFAVISYHIISYHIISYHISYHIIYHIGCHIISYRVSYHIISYRVSYHIISYHFISYHIISYIIYHIIYHIIYRIVSHIIRILYHIMSYHYIVSIPHNPLSGIDCILSYSIISYTVSNLISDEMFESYISARWHYSIYHTMTGIIHRMWRHGWSDIMLYLISFLYRISHVMILHLTRHHIPYQKISHHIVYHIRCHFVSCPTPYLIWCQIAPHSISRIMPYLNKSVIVSCVGYMILYLIPRIILYHIMVN